jgi:hypothetical protein
MTEFGGSAVNPTARLQRILDGIDGMSEKEMTLFGVDDYDLGNINRIGRVADGVGPAAIRTTLQRVLSVRPPLSIDYTYIDEQMPDLAYSDNERQAIEDAKLAASHRKTKIAEEIAGGADPWLTHVKHNERDILNPLTVGFYQDEKGRIRSIHGPRYFLSKRQIENSIFGGRTELKEVNLLDGEFTPIVPTEILKGTHWGALPDDLREHFENGRILVTTGNDHYAQSAQDIAEVSQSDDPEAFMKQVDQKVQRADSDYMLLYYSDYGGENTGRTAVVMTKNDEGELEPVVVQVGDKEFLVEVKGCGTKIGGFKGMHSRTGRDIITGGAEAEQARTEFYRLEDDTREGAPKAVGSILFDNPDELEWNPKNSTFDTPYAQGYVIRLTPSTVRASYTGNEAYPDIEEPEFVERILQIYTSQLTDHMFADQPKILDRSSHTENILVWNNGEFTFTDYSDHVAFADKNFPHYDNYGGDMTPKKMLEYYLAMVQEVPGYRKDRDQQTFYAQLCANLEAQGIELVFEEDEGVKELAEKIWNGGMAYQVYRGRKKGQYFPAGILQQFVDNFDSDIASHGLPRDSSEAFVAGEAKAREDLLKVLRYYRTNSDITLPEGVDFDEWEQVVRTAPITELSPIAGKISHIQYQGDNHDKISEHDRRWLIGKTGYYGALNYVMVSQFCGYFEHELDVITAAQQGCPDEARAELVAAETEIRARLDRIHYLVDHDLAGLYEAVATPEAARKMLSLSFYNLASNEDTV